MKYLQKEETDNAGIMWINELDTAQAKKNSRYSISLIDALKSEVLSKTQLISEL
jgi:hypothetical protein